MQWVEELGMVMILAFLLCHGSSLWGLRIILRTSCRTPGKIQSILTPSPPLCKVYHCYGPLLRILRFHCSFVTILILSTYFSSCVFLWTARKKKKEKKAAAWTTLLWRTPPTFYEFCFHIVAGDNFTTLTFSPLYHSLVYFSFKALASPSQRSFVYQPLSRAVNPFHAGPFFSLCPPSSHYKDVAIP